LVHGSFQTGSHVWCGIGLPHEFASGVAFDCWKSHIPGSFVDTIVVRSIHVVKSVSGSTELMADVQHRRPLGRGLSTIDCSLDIQ